MTDPYTTPPTTREAAKQEAGVVAQTAGNEAGAVKDSAVQSGQQLAQHAKSEAKEVAAHAQDQLRTLASTARDEMRGRAWDTHGFATTNVRSWSDELQQVLRGESTGGPVNQLAQTLSSKGQDLATWLENHDPDDVMREVRRFAARRPFAFIALAAGAGLLAGRFARGAKDADSDDDLYAREPYATQGYGLSAKDYYAQRRAAAVTPQPVVPFDGGRPVPGAESDDALHLDPQLSEFDGPRDPSVDVTREDPR
ncbi:hypothetical protein [Aestuariimicrobium ganziense]|uniref:hypothetical protein n=1 Tax=Aestuariimicrobium ganziense TaxID=2773677 RepID=UPI001942B607|nr:hypothetical protein [Aestuariimicrobium ganziense]